MKKTCEICFKKFEHNGSKKTCSPMCSDELRRKRIKHFKNTISEEESAYQLLEELSKTIEFVKERITTMKRISQTPKEWELFEKGFNNYYEKVN